jgi:acyl-CoA synthetase (AMP-forming)/AMP-acid ligase II/acyl carrier protein
MSSQTAPFVSRSHSTRFFSSGAVTLLDLARIQAETNPELAAYSFLSDGGGATSLTFGELDWQARCLAVEILRQVEPGARVALVFPPGLDFVVAFLGCVYAGVLAVPATYPKPRRPMPRLNSILSDCGAELALTTSAALATIERTETAGLPRDLKWVSVDAVDTSLGANWEAPVIQADDTAYLQYTSGSTSEPKGVMISHANVLHNLEMIFVGNVGERNAKLKLTGRRTSVSWLPAYHDMGLICGVLGALYEGGHGVLMSPTAFLQRPWQWLKAISDYRANVAGGPNFAYDLCIRKITPEQRAELDLSSWEVAFCSAEPIQHETLKRFNETFRSYGFRGDTFYPCYGLAEGTLLAAGSLGPRQPKAITIYRAALAHNRIELGDESLNGAGQKLIACGGPLLGQELIIVDPQTHAPLSERAVGEIWLHGPSIGHGYWNRPEDTRRVFQAHTTVNETKKYLRTGDLGFLHEGELYVTGRLKDVIIIRGRNHYPQDIERTVAAAHPALAAGAGAAFSLDVNGQEVLAIAFEVDRHQQELEPGLLVRSIRRAVAHEHELEVHAVVLVRQASLPRTTSGKMQRHLCRERYLADELKVLEQWVNDGKWAQAQQRLDSNPLPIVQAGQKLSELEIDRLTQRIESWLVDWMVARASVAPEEIDRNRPFAEYGLDSFSAVELSHDLQEQLGIELTAVIAWSHPTPAAMARYLARTAAGEEPATPALSDSEEADFDRLLAEVEQATDEEAQAAISDASRG